MHQNHGHSLGSGPFNHALEFCSLRSVLERAHGLGELGHDLNILALSILANLAQLLGDR
jgi:hypothetical protein